MPTLTMPFPPHTPPASMRAIEERLWQARPRLLRIARAIGVPPDSAEDIAQETTLRAWRHAASVRDVSRFDAWLDAICRNQCRMYLRALRRAPESAPLMLTAVDGLEHAPGSASDDLPDPRAVDPLDILSANDATALLERAFTYLPPQDRLLLEQIYIHALPSTAVAGALGVTTHVLDARLHRARAHLRRALMGPLRADAEDFGLDAQVDDGWQATRIGCYLCGRRKLLGRFETAVNGRVELRLRCPACSMSSTSDVFRSKGIAALDGVRTFRPALTRSLRALAEHTHDVLTGGADVCLHCGHAAPRRVVAAEEYPGALSPARAQYWIVAPCPQSSCPGLGAWTALDALIGAEPLAQRFIADHPRWVTAPELATEWQGAAAIRFHLRDVASAARLTVLADRDTLRTLGAY